jgi:dipeptidyl aminopeptidase/acylaminoacyl peptidase
MPNPMRAIHGWFFIAPWIAMAAMPVQATASRAFVYDDLFRVDQVVDAKISPDAERVAVVTERRKPEAYHARIGSLWIVSRKGGEPRRVGGDDPIASVQQPVWSPDGKRLLYRVSHEKTNTLAVLDLETWRSPRVQPCAEGETAGVVIWAPDARGIVVVCSGKSPLTVSGDGEQKKATTGKTLDDKRIVATRSPLYDDALARPWSAQRRVVVFDLAEGSQKELMRSELLLDEPGALQWQSSGDLWITATPPNPFGGMSFVNGRVIHRYEWKAKRLHPGSVSIETSRMPLLTGASGHFLIPSRGSVGGSEPSQFRKTWEAEPLVLSEMRDGDRTPNSLGKLDIYVGRSAPFVWASDATASTAGGVLYFQWFDRGSNRIKAFRPSQQGNARWQDVTPAGTSVPAFSISADGRTMALIRGDANTPNDVYLLDLADRSAQPSRLTRFGDAVTGAFAVSSVETVQWRSGDDRFDIGGWLLKPADYVEGKRYPLILLVHGGPGVAFHNTFDALHFYGAHQVAPELYLSRGYLVLMVNPRGDPGYGKAHQEALLEGWEYPTRHDLLVGVQEMVRRGYADPERLGIAGASYGGWVTAFAVTQTDMFKAASAHDPVIDTRISSAVAYRGNLLTNYWLHAGFVKDHLLDAPFPTSDPRKVNTPVLLRFGLRDQPPMPSQFFVSGLEYFTYLHAHCKPVEMILHPEEGHGIGDGEALKDYVDRDLAWFDYWLLGKGELPYKPHTCAP